MKENDKMKWIEILRNIKNRNSERGSCGVPPQTPERGSVTRFKMSSIKALNPKAEVARFSAALEVNMSAAKGLQDVLKTNLGPKGTMKM